MRVCSPVKFFYCNRAKGAVRFRPYDLVVTPRQKVWLSRCGLLLALLSALCTRFARPAPGFTFCQVSQLSAAGKAAVARMSDAQEPDH